MCVWKEGERWKQMVDQTLFLCSVKDIYCYNLWLALTQLWVAHCGIPGHPLEGLCFGHSGYCWLSSWWWQSLLTLLHCESAVCTKCICSCPCHLLSACRLLRSPISLVPAVAFPLQQIQPSRPVNRSFLARTDSCWLGWEVPEHLVAHAYDNCSSWVLNAVSSLLHQAQLCIQRKRVSQTATWAWALRSQTVGQHPLSWMTSKVRNGAIKEDGECADSAVRVRFFFCFFSEIRAAFSRCIGKFVDICNVFASWAHFMYFLQSSVIFPV